MFRLAIYRRKATPSSGSVTWNTPHLQGDIISIHIKPTTATTTYTFQILGVNGLVLFKPDIEIVGELAQSFQADSCNEIMTCSITSASADEEFIIEIRVRIYENAR